MKIKIAERFRPFTHAPGEPCLLPLSTLQFEIFPVFIRIKDLSESSPRLVAEIPLKLRGPVKNFTVMQDLEHPSLRAWGHSVDGFFRYRIHAGGKFGFTFTEEKCPEGLQSLFAEQYSSGSIPPFEPIVERLSFGVTKIADWALVKRRSILAEILPFWFRLGGYIPKLGSLVCHKEDLLSSCQTACLNKDKLGLSEALSQLFIAGFEGLLSPTLSDPFHQGVPMSAIGAKTSPLHLLKEGAELIKGMLINQVSDEIEILPCLMPELHAGRFCNASIGELGSIDLEWTKKRARRLIFRSFKDQKVHFRFQKDLKTLRFTEEKGPSQRFACGELLHFEAQKTYFFDRFEQ